LLKKWEDMKGNYNMVHAEMHKNKKKNEEVNLRVVTHGWEKIGEEFEHEESLGQQVEGKVRKASHPPPKLMQLLEKQDRGAIK
jgi:hypothetical protein